MFSAFGMAVVEFVATKAKEWLVEEVRPLIIPHPSEALTKQFASLLHHLAMSVDDDARKNAPPELLAIIYDLEQHEPDTYTGNTYRQLMDVGLLPRGGPWQLIGGVAECTPDDPISNRTRWTLQMLLVHYQIRFGSPNLNESFLYVWHDTAFQFAGQSRTIGKLAWAVIRITPAIKAGEWAACKGIEVANQPDGTIPRYGVPVRFGFDAGSRLFYD